MKHFHGTQRSGITFGMYIETNTAAYREMKRNTKAQTVTGHHGIPVQERGNRKTPQLLQEKIKSLICASHLTSDYIHAIISLANTAQEV